jgi:hypothetical protein
MKRLVTGPEGLSRKTFKQRTQRREKLMFCSCINIIVVISNCRSLGCIHHSSSFNTHYDWDDNYLPNMFHKYSLTIIFYCMQI